MTRFSKQQYLVYKWENENLLRGPNLSEAQMQKLTQSIYECLGLDAEQVHTPNVRVGRGGQASWWYSHTRKIRMNHESLEVILHEVAHALTDDLYADNGTRDGNHGPIFVRIMLELNEHYQSLDLKLMLKSARSYGIKIYNKPALCWLPEESSGPSY